MKSEDVERRTKPPDHRPLDEQPKWRKDFPIDWADDEYVSRRDYVKFLLLVSAAFTTGQFWILADSWLTEEESFAPAPIAEVADIPVGGATTFEYPEGSSSRLLIRLDEDRFAAYDQKCTHLQCPVVPAVDKGRLHCPCHNAWFDAESGRVLAGPPRRPLTRITLTIEDGTIYATGVEERTT